MGEHQSQTGYVHVPEPQAPHLSNGNGEASQGHKTTPDGSL